MKWLNILTLVIFSSELFLQGNCESPVQKKTAYVTGTAPSQYVPQGSHRPTFETSYDSPNNYGNYIRQLLQSYVNQPPVTVYEWKPSYGNTNPAYQPVAPYNPSRNYISSHLQTQNVPIRSLYQPVSYYPNRQQTPYPVTRASSRMHFSPQPVQPYPAKSAYPPNPQTSNTVPNRQYHTANLGPVIDSMYPRRHAKGEKLAQVPSYEGLQRASARSSDGTENKRFLYGSYTSQPQYSKPNNDGFSVPPRGGYGSQGYKKEDMIARPNYENVSLESTKIAILQMLSKFKASEQRKILHDLLYQLADVHRPDKDKPSTSDKHNASYEGRKSSAVPLAAAP